MKTAWIETDVLEHTDDQCQIVPGSARRARPLVLRSDDRCVIFSGDSIPGVCRVLAAEHCKDGKWSRTTWKIRIASGVGAWTIDGPGFVRDLRTNKWENFYTAISWQAIAEACPREVLRLLSPKQAERIDQAELPV